MDHRFFYKDPRLGFRATSGIVERLVYRVWTTKAAADDSLLARWPLILDLMNRWNLSFQVQEIIKAQVRRFGVVGMYPKAPDCVIKRFPFDAGTELATVEKALKGRDSIEALCFCISNARTHFI